MDLTDHCDGICCFPWPQDAHRLLAGFVLAENMRMKTKLLNHLFKLLVKLYNERPRRLFTKPMLWG